MAARGRQGAPISLVVDLHPSSFIKSYPSISVNEISSLLKVTSFSKTPASAVNAKKKRNV